MKHDEIFNLVEIVIDYFQRLWQNKVQNKA